MQLALLLLSRKHLDICNSKTLWEQAANRGSMSMHKSLYIRHLMRILHQHVSGSYETPCKQLPPE